MTRWDTPAADRLAEQQRYRQLVRRVREATEGVLPAGATVLVVSKGDEELLRLGGCRAWHFPRDGRGGYAGHYPANGAAAVAHLEALRAQGADHLLLPATAFWWLDHYKELKDHLHTHGRVVLRLDETCLLWEMGGRPNESRPDGDAMGQAVNQQLVCQIREVVASLLPAGATVLVVSKGDEELVKLGGCRAWHFPQDGRGGYAGYYPADGAAAVAHLEALRAQGADYLLLPSTAFWWLDRYKEFRQHLYDRCRVVTDQEHVCVIVDLHKGKQRQRAATRRPGSLSGPGAHTGG